MKLIAFTAAGVLFASALAPVPAEAQRQGWHSDRHWNGAGYRGDRRYRGGNRWRGQSRWRGQNRWRGGRARSRVVCHWQRGYYGPVRRCVRVWR